MHRINKDDISGSAELILFFKPPIIGQYYKSTVLNQCKYSFNATLYIHILPLLYLVLATCICVIQLVVQRKNLSKTTIGHTNTGCENTLTNISSLFFLAQFSNIQIPTWKQSWSWPRISNRSCCVVLVELFLRTSFCWLKNIGSCWLWDNSSCAVVSIYSGQTLLWDWESLTYCPNLCRITKSKLDPVKPLKNTPIL